MSDLHSQIMNLPCTPATADELQGYRRGHRDARHAAAELALAQDARILQLEEALTMLYVETADYITLNSLGDVHHNRSMQLARDALKEPS